MRGCGSRKTPSGVGGRGAGPQQTFGGVGLKSATKQRRRFFGVGLHLGAEPPRTVYVGIGAEVGSRTPLDVPRCRAEVGDETPPEISWSRAEGKHRRSSAGIWLKSATNPPIGGVRSWTEAKPHRSFPGIGLNPGAETPGTVPSEVFPGVGLKQNPVGGFPELS